MSTADAAGRIHDLLAAAMRAPSSHNTQPWAFHVHGDVVDVLADRTRALPVNDPEDRELTISCGTAIFHLRVAAAAAGFATDVELRRADDVPLGDDVDVVARVTITGGAPDQELAALAPAIDRRRTCRGAFQSYALPHGLSAELAEAATAEGATLTALQDERSREILRDLVAAGDRTQFGDRHWRRELAAWMHPRRERDGLVVGDHAARATRLVLSTIDLGRTWAGRDAALVQRAPFVAVLSTEADGVNGWLGAGQAISRMLLTAAGHGIMAGWLNQPCQVEELRPRLRELTGHDGLPQVVLRFGLPMEEPGATPRRSVDATLL